MGFLLNSGEVGNIGLKHLKVIKEQTINKWNSLGFLDGLNGHQKENIAQLYENQATAILNEGSDSNSSGSFETVVFPIVRRVFSKLLANELVSVQALNLPIGKLFFFIPKISGGPNNMVGVPCGGDGCASGNTFESRSLYDAFYEDANGLENNSLFDRSKSKFTTITGITAAYAVFTQVVGPQGNTQNVLTPTVTPPSVPVTGLRETIICLSGFSSAGAGHITDARGNEQDTEEFLASLQIRTTNAINTISGSSIYAANALVDFRVVTQQYGKGIVNYGDICDANGVIYLGLDTQTPACITCSNVDGYEGASAAPALTGITATWRKYESLELEDELSEVSFDLSAVTVTVTDRKLRAAWSPELAQDVAAFQNIDAEAELTALLSEQIAAEIDREILKDLRKGAAWNLRWDYNGWKRVANGHGSAGYTQKDWNQTLVTAVNQISAQIHKSTLRGGANWIVVSSEISAIFDDLEYFHVSNAATEQDQYNMGIEKVGSLGGRYTVYRDPYFPANKILMGHKGKSLLDTGYVYAPYVPLQLTPTLYNPFNFAPVKGIMTRYAKRMVNNRFYGSIKVDGVRTFNINELR